MLTGTCDSGVYEYSNQCNLHRTVVGSSERLSAVCEQLSFLQVIIDSYWQLTGLVMSDDFCSLKKGYESRWTICWWSGAKKGFVIC